MQNDRSPQAAWMPEVAIPIMLLVAVSGMIQRHSEAVAGVAVVQRPGETDHSDDHARERRDDFLRRRMPGEVIRPPSKEQEDRSSDRQHDQQPTENPE